jgi:hypothetical protein
MARFASLSGMLQAGSGPVTSYLSKNSFIQYSVDEQEFLCGNVTVKRSNMTVYFM